MILQQGKGFVGCESGAFACSGKDRPCARCGGAIQTTEKPGQLARGSQGAMTLIEESADNFHVF